MWQLFILVGVFSVLPWPASAAGSCLGYEFVSLPGTIVRQTYAGPPDYESVTKGDAPQVIWVLLLERGICVVDGNSRFPRVLNEREIQLEWETGADAQYRSLLGRKVIATGQLVRGGAMHDKRLVLMASEIRKARPAQ